MRPFDESSAVRRHEGGEEGAGSAPADHGRDRRVGATRDLILPDSGRHAVPHLRVAAAKFSLYAMQCNNACEIGHEVQAHAAEE